MYGVPGVCVEIKLLFHTLRNATACSGIVGNSIIFLWTPHFWRWVGKGKPMNVINPFSIVFSWCHRNVKYASKKGCRPHAVNGWYILWLLKEMSLILTFLVSYRSNLVMIVSFFPSDQKKRNKKKKIKKEKLVGQTLRSRAESRSSPSQYTQLDAGWQTRLAVYDLALLLAALSSLYTFVAGNNLHVYIFGCCC